MIVAIRTPFALESSFRCMKMKNARMFNIAPILMSFVKTPLLIAISKESIIECPFPKIKRVKVRPKILANKPTIMPNAVGLFFIKIPSV